MDFVLSQNKKFNEISHLRSKKQQFDSKHSNVTWLVRPPRSEMTSLDFTSSEEMMAMRLTFFFSTSIGWIALKFDAQDAFSKTFKNKKKEVSFP